MRDNAGNTLMGPTHFNYRRVMGHGTEHVYLCEAEAAMLSTNPAFRAGWTIPARCPNRRHQT